MPFSLSPRFVLKPWEFEGAPHSPFADAVVSCEWNGTTVSMRLKVRENLLFFAPVGEYDGRLFALSIPLDESEEAANGWKSRPEKLKQRFAHDLKNGDWGRCVFVRFESICEISHCKIVYALAQLNGQVQIRRLYGDNVSRAVVSWEKAPRFGLHPDCFSTWPHAKLRRFLQAQPEAECRLFAAAYGHRLTNHHDAPAHFDTSRALIEPQWIKGNSQTLLLWVGLAAQLCSAIRADEKQIGVHEPGFQIAGRGAANPMRIERNSPWMYKRLPPVFLRLFELFCREHRFVSQRINETHNRANHPEHFLFVPFVPGQMSQHERLEAMMQLREEVRGTSIERAVGEILARIK